MDWFPESDETLLYRGRVGFATGRATKVAGMRWFRDENGRDIAGELPGWPEGPVYTPRGDAAVRTTKTLGGIGKGVVVIAAMAINAVSNANPDVSVGDGARSADPALEIDDFPVMIAAPDTMARTLPFQLDRDRRPEHYATDLAVTERRVLVLGVDTQGGLNPAQVLWEAPREVLGSVVKHAFGTKGGDLSFVFKDGSRARLNLEYGAAPAIQLTAELCPAHRVELNELVLKKLKRRSAPTRLEHTWEAVRQDDGKVMAQRVYVIDGKQSRDGGEFGRYNVTKWVDEPGVGSGDGASA
ncbi:MAG: hypothetical protein JF587_03330 [Catenulisporales bacterium]|jgi:hypothetical protein|nr:hypothetical protein [Catenulisporales bacterium]